MKPLTDNLQYYIETELILGGEKVKCEHNPKSPARPRTRTAPPRPRTNIFSVRLSRAVSKRLLPVDLLYSDYSLQVLSCIHNRKIIRFSFPMIASIIKTLVCVICLNVGLVILAIKLNVMQSVPTLPLFFRAGL